jgi:hypothetical protein
MNQQWLQVLGLLLDVLGFGLITLEWYRGYVELKARANMQARDMERMAKARLKKEYKDVLANVGVAEVQGLYEDDAHLADVAEMQWEQQRVERFERSRALPFVLGAVAVSIGFMLQLAGNWPGCCTSIGIIPQGH